MDKKTNTSGLGITGTITIVFIILKLVGTINWSWWWVFSPILIDIGLTIIILAVYAILYNRSITKKGKQDKWKF